MVFLQMGLLIGLALGGSCGRRDQPDDEPEDPTDDADPRPNGGSGDGQDEGRPGDFSYTVSVDGKSRSYLVHVPQVSGGGALPAVLNFHGGGGRAEIVPTTTGMNATADRYGFLAVYPEGTTGGIVGGHPSNTWNAGRCCGKAMADRVDDAAFVEAILDDLQRRFPLDVRRVYATGISNGGMLTYRLACEIADRIAAIAPVSTVGVFGSDVGTFDRCQPARSVPTIHFQGRADPCILYDGGQSPDCYRKFIQAYLGIDIGPISTWVADSIPDFTAAWATINNATGAESEFFDQGETTCTSRGSGVATTVLCVTEDSGHTWPGGNHGSVCDIPTSRACLTWKDTVGSITEDFSANEMMWNFFKDHPLE